MAGLELLDGESNYLIAKARTAAEQLARMRPSNDFERELFVETLFDCAIQMGCGVDGANEVIQAAMAVGTAK